LSNRSNNNSFKIQTQGADFSAVLLWDNPMDMGTWIEEFKKIKYKIMIFF